MNADALAKAREIAARLSGELLHTFDYLHWLIGALFIGSISGTGSELGKRKNRWGEDEGNLQAAGCKWFSFSICVV